MSGPDPLDWAQEWMASAAIDLDAAELWMERRSHGFGIACFHAEQAAEKALKALLVAAGIDPPRTHDLELLAGLLPVVPAALDRSSLASLAPWAVMGRYDLRSPGATRTQAEDAIRVARTVVEAASQALTPDPD